MKNFNVNGPVEVSETALAAYQAKDWGGFDRMFYAWLDEKNSDEIRRLLIRDLLRQSYGSIYDTKNVCHRTADGFGRIFRVGGGDKKSELYWTLFNRPKLLAEVTEEFLYNLRKNLVSLESSREKESVVELIEFLMSLTNDKQIKELWRHHPVNTQEMSEAEKVKSLLKLWSPTMNMKAWMRDELWADIEKIIRDELTSNEHILAHAGDVYVYEKGVRMDATMELISFVSDLSHSNSSNYQVVDVCLGLIEDNLLLGVTYFNLSGVVRIVQRLPHNTALRLSRRHVIATKPDECRMYFGSLEGRNFLFWLKGMATRVDSVSRQTLYDQELLNKIQEIFDVIDADE